MELSTIPTYIYIPIKVANCKILFINNKDVTYSTFMKKWQIKLLIIGLFDLQN